ncbi:hypothetical protein GCM10022393_15630 [Aquimarina addita]|uniref:Condensation domain-containing protein n=1 Tax=Aquimarina addita TaxID=870485 RepID=A0ABP7XGA6_9FLAO
MKIDKYISNLRSKNIIIHIQDGRIAVKASDGAITAAIVAELTAKKQEILDFFESIKKTKKHTESIIEDILKPPEFNRQQDHIIYEEGQYDVLDIQKLRYEKTYNASEYERLQFLLHKKLDNINVKAFFEAMDTLVERHENLRTLYLDKEGVILQQIYPPDTFESNVSVIDISSIAQEKKEGTIRHMIEELSNHIFDFKNERAFKCQLIKYDKDKYYFTFLMDHMIYDGQATTIINNELFTLYDCYSKGISNPFEPLKLQFKDYVAYNNQHYKGDKLSYHKSFYRNLFKEIPPKFHIEPDKLLSVKESKIPIVQPLLNSETDTYAGGIFRSTISKEISNGIQNLIIDCNVSLFNFLLATFSILFTKISDQNDFVFFSPFSTRSNEDFQKIVGWFGGMLISRVKLNRDQTFKDLLFHCRKVATEAMDHVHYQPFTSDLNLDWDRLVSAQINVGNNFNNAEHQLVDFEPYHGDIPKPSLDINFGVGVYKNGMEITCDYNRELISKTQISNICKEYLKIIKASISTLDTKIKNWIDVDEIH